MRIARNMQAILIFLSLTRQLRRLGYNPSLEFQS
jgi:hypothetical protein